MLQRVERARQQAEARLQFATDPYDLERFYPTTDEGAEQLIEDMITTTHISSSPRPPHSSSGSDIQRIHEENEALEGLLGAEEILLELGLIFLPPEIQQLYQAHQVARREVLIHSPAHEVGFALGMNGRERGNRYRTLTPYPRCRTRQRKVYVADKHKQRYEDDYDPDLDHHYDLYL